MQGLHPVTCLPLPEEGRSWLGRLADEAKHAGVWGEERHTDWQRAPTRDEQAQAKHSYRFLDGRLPTTERTFDSFLQDLAAQVRGSGPPPTKDEADSDEWAGLFAT